MATFAEALGDAMRAKGYVGRGAQARLARDTGVDTSYLNRIIKGKVERPEIEMLRKLARGLGDLEGLARAANRLPEMVCGEDDPRVVRRGVADELAAGILRERPDVAEKFRELDEKYADRPHVAEQMKGHILRQLASTVSNSLDIALADT